MGAPLFTKCCSHSPFATPTPTITSWLSAPLTLHRGAHIAREELTPGEKARLRAERGLMKGLLGVLAARSANMCHRGCQTRAVSASVFLEDRTVRLKASFTG